MKKKLYPVPSSKGLVCSIPMYYGTTSGTLLYDETGNGYNGTATNSPVPKFPAFQFTAASSMYIDIGAAYNGIKTTALWVKPNAISGTDYPIDLNGTDYLTIETGTLTANGFAGGTTVLYVDGVVGTGVTADWHFIAITDTSGKNASDLDIGRKDAGYFDGLIAGVRLYKDVLTASEIRSLYEITRQRYAR